MAVMAREAWTDERLDDFKENVNHRFDAVDKRFDRVEAEMKVGFAEVNARFDSMQRTMLIGFFTLLASVWASVVGAVLAVLL